MKQQKHNISQKAPSSTTKSPQAKAPKAAVSKPVKIEEADLASDLENQGSEL